MFQRYLKRLCIGLGLCITTHLKADPKLDTAWRRIRTPHFDILFRANISREANRVANILEHCYQPVAQSLHVQPKKTRLILRNQKAVANGFTIPGSMEFFTFPSQSYDFSMEGNWLNLLALHEFRHIVQLEKIKIWAPSWFLEGDAVGIETALSKGGRGRIPYFGLLYKVNLVEHQGISYQKQVRGSFQHQIPNHYRVGYYLTTHLRRHYGANALSRILRQANTWPYLFPLTFKKAISKGITEVYKDANKELLAQWQRQLKGLRLTPVQNIVTREHTDYIDYLYPQVSKNDNIIALKTGIGTIAHFTLLGQKEQIIFTPGYIDQNAGFSIAQDKIVWVEQVPDIRWPDRCYSDIQIYDIPRRKYATLTRRGRYGAAALSPDATQIVAYESDECYEHQLVILDAHDGRVVHRFPNPNNHTYQAPKWASDGKHIVAVKNTTQGSTIELITRETGCTQDLLPLSYEVIGWPVMHESYVFYHSAYSGIDNIYVIDLSTKQRYQVTSSKYGAYNPRVAADGRRLIFNDFTKYGMDVVQIPIDSSQWVPIEQVEDRSLHYYAPLVEQEGSINILEDIPQHTYPIARYNLFTQLIDPGSWRLGCYINEDIGLKLQNLLNTASLKLGCTYDCQNNLGSIYTELNYRGWYPVITIQPEISIPFQNAKGKQRSYKTLNLGVSLPLVYVRRLYTYTLSLSTMSGIPTADRALTQNYQVSLARTSKKSLRDIYSPWRQTCKVSYRHTPGITPQAYCSYTQVGFNFPGLLRHHSLRLIGKVNYKYDLGQILNLGGLLRGYQNTKSSQYQAKMSYTWPIKYPDWEIGLIAYVKRISANLSYEYSYKIKEKQYGQVIELALEGEIILGEEFGPIKIAIGCTYQPGNRKIAPILKCMGLLCSL